LTQAALILVVAPDADFRHSLEFALETDGFAVESYENVDAAFASQRAGFARCAVLDDGAIADWQMLGEEALRFGKPVILLMDRVRRVPDLPHISELTKPFLGAPLTEAVRRAMAEPGHT
jgi:DNA-binding NtrC family response regulator